MRTIQLALIYATALLLAGELHSVRGAESLLTDRAAWMQKARWGVMTHYLADWKARDHDFELSVEKWNQLMDGFEAEG